MTESELSPNELIVNTQAGENYYIRQYMKMGVFVGGANLELVDEQKAQQGVCSGKPPAAMEAVVE